MARPKKTDPDAALMAAMLLFWREGYHALGTRQIEEETGITRFTLQTSYGGKKALFLKALDHYLDMFDKHLAPAMQTGKLDGLSAWLQDLPAPEALRPQLCHGCLMINSILAFPRSDEEVNLRAARYFTQLRAAFATALQQARDSGELAPDFDCAIGAEVLLALSMSRNITNKSAAENAAPQTVGIAAATLIDSWRQN
ncbi:TetR/AcrR family transcriptional regulator [Thalassobius sp. MITS945101]|uniref:TetR/AcrR family transcriptional regulator n=1 Tax=Thalassobius sp. MITS945101 TaxID=3096994 RepID=UPI00399A13B4